jgi:hypothetical protein
LKTATAMSFPALQPKEEVSTEIQTISIKTMKPADCEIIYLKEEDLKIVEEWCKNGMFDILNKSGFTSDDFDKEYINKRLKYHPDKIKTTLCKKHGYLMKSINKKNNKK